MFIEALIIKSTVRLSGLKRHNGIKCVHVTLLQQVALPSTAAEMRDVESLF
jgi:hypothetical protein